MKVITFTEDKKGKVKKTRIGKPKKAFTAIIKEGELMMNVSWGGDTKTDKHGNDVTVYLWVTGDWKVDYKGKEYLIPMSENVNALIEWINEKEK